MHLPHLPHLQGHLDHARMQQCTGAAHSQRPLCYIKRGMKTSMMHCAGSQVLHRPLVLCNTAQNCLPCQPVCKPFCRPARRTHSSLHRSLRHDRLEPCRANFLDVAWGVTGDLSAQDLAASMFSFSIIPYAGFLYYLTRSKRAPPLALFGFYFLLVFVFGTIPAGIIAKIRYGTTLANVDFLHGPAESLLTITNLLIVLGFRRAIIQAEQEQAAETTDTAISDSLEQQAAGSRDATTEQ